MASLIALPPELLVEIMSYIQDQTSLYRFSQCSRLANDVAVPYLYRNVVFTQKYSSTRCADTHLYAALHVFASQVFTSPTKASFVKSFVLRLSFNSEMGSHMRDIPLSVQNHSLNKNIRNAISHSRRLTGRSWTWSEEVAWHSNLEALLAILLLSLPRLEHLELPLPPENQYLSHVLHCTIDRHSRFYSSTAFERLQTVKITSYNQALDSEADGIRSSQLALWLQIPSLKHISARRSGSERERRYSVSWEIKPLTSLPAASSGVSSVSLEGSLLYDGEMRAIVVACKALKTLELQWIDVRSPESYPFLAYLPGFATAATCASETLETLALTYASSREIVHHVVSREHDARIRVSLALSPRLRQVTLGMVFIFGPRFFAYNENEDVLPNTHVNLARNLARLLPPSIETLRLVRCEGEAVAPLLMNVEELLLRKEDSFKSLRSVAVENQFPCHKFILSSRELLGSYESEDALWELRTLAREVGVKFRMMDPETDYGDTAS